MKRNTSYNSPKEDFSYTIYSFVLFPKLVFQIISRAIGSGKSLAYLKSAAILHSPKAPTQT